MKNAQLREAELVAEIIKPAQAEAERVRIQARAAAEATRLAAEAAASEGRIALDQQLITLLPQMIQAAAQGLNGANVTVLNGATGLNEAVASLAGQGLAILQSVKTGCRVTLTAARRRPPRTPSTSPRPSRPAGRRRCSATSAAYVSAVRTRRHGLTAETEIASRATPVTGRNGVDEPGVGRSMRTAK
jgi:hypothetical protein